jgi:hypothetical protein
VIVEDTFARFEEVMRRLSPQQSTILWNTEAIDTFRLGPQLPVLEVKVDFTASYEMGSDVPLMQGFPTWVTPNEFVNLNAPLQRRRPGAIAWLASNCDTTTNGRTAFVRELMRFIRVDSFGKCLNNKPLPSGIEAQRSSGRKFWADKVRLLADYNFTLVLENSNSHDYVTEKLFQALIAGSVPIYMGAPNVENFLPAPDAAIRVGDFPSPRALADYLTTLQHNSSAFEQLHAWRRRPLPPSFVHLWNISWDSAKCRICQVLAEPGNAQPRARQIRQRKALGSLDALLQR